MLREELDRAIRRPVNADLRTSPESEAVLEADLRAGVEAEQIPCQIAEIAVAERPRKAMRHAECALELRQAQRRRQRDQREIGLSEVDVQIGIVLRLRGQRASRRKKKGDVAVA